jgi:hypothetical protein
MTTNRWLAAARWSLIVLTVAGLAIDAYVHFDLASTYDFVRTSTLSQGDLFRAEAVASVVAAAGLLVRPRRYTALFAVLVAGSGAAALLIYRYYNIGSIGPIPSMYEPLWYPEKTAAAWAEVAATVTALAEFALEHLRRPRPRPTVTGLRSPAVN